MSVLAIDIDLGRITAVHSELGVIAHGENPFTPTFFGMKWKAALSAQTILVEVAGPIMHHEESHSHRRWMLYNVAVAATLASSWAGKNVLLATSTAWTKGFSEIDRASIAGIAPKKYKTVTRKKGGRSVVTREPIWAEPHDVRECRTMIYFYARAPEPWKPLDQYLKELVGK